MEGKQKRNRYRHTYTQYTNIHSPLNTIIQLTRYTTLVCLHVLLDVVCVCACVCCLTVCVCVCQDLVRLHVLLDVGLLGEGTPTHNALEGLLPGVAAGGERRQG